jgi:glycosyltransferase involved in cell wall biosynthesis
VVIADAAAPTPAPKPRAVLLVANAAAPYSRGLRVARTLAADGWDVEIAAVTAADQPPVTIEGPVTVRRYAPSGRWARFATDRPRPAVRGLRGRILRLADIAVRASAWPVHVRGWWHTLERDLPPADLYHAFGILAIPAALDLAARDRGQGRSPRVVYDVIDVILESNNVDRMPRPLLAWNRRRERRWAHRAEAIVTVNDPIAEHLERIWGLARRPITLLNCQPRWTPPNPQPDHIRAAGGLPPDRRVVLFLGRLGRERGLDEAAEAVLKVPDTALALIGFGPWADRLRQRDTDPKYAGHHVTLPPVHPDLVPEWTASADATIVAVPANSLNQRLSTPNKFWESLTAGTPLVVGRDLEVMRAIVEEERIGAVADPMDADDLARALSEVLDQPPDERAAMRARLRRAADDRYNWESAAVAYRELVEGFKPR